VRDYWVYVPAQYVPEKPVCVMVFQDGKMFVSENDRARIPIVFDNLIARHDMPVTIAILIEPGVLKGSTLGEQDRLNRSYEYDGLSDRYARFLLDEILPEVARHYNLSTNPNDRAISGLSSGGICSFTVAWMHPEAFRRVLSYIGSFTDLRGGDIYPALIRKTEPKPLRVFLQDGNHDLNIYGGDWWLANQSMASALTFAGYDVKFVAGDKDHDMIQGGAIMPDALRWLWRDYPQPISKPAIHPLGNPQIGFVDMAPDWQLVSDQGEVPHKSPQGTLDLPSMLSGSPSQKSAQGIAVDQQGRVFFSNLGGKHIFRVDLDGKVSTFIKDAGRATGIAFSRDGELYVCENRTGRIVSYAADGTKRIRAGNIVCEDLAVTRAGGIYFTAGDKIGYLPPGSSKPVDSPNDGQGDFERIHIANRVCLSPDQSLVYVSDLTGKRVWSFKVQADGSLANGEPYFRMETLDDSSDSGATGMVVDSQGLLFVSTRLGIQVCDEQGRVAAILNQPGRAEPWSGQACGLVFGGRDHQYLYAVVGNEVFRRHLERKHINP
jgi:enterochelin esterase-like enzyme/sugar lactone lactonase YvrE